MKTAMKQLTTDCVAILCKKFGHFIVTEDVAKITSDNEQNLPQNV